MHPGVEGEAFDLNDSQVKVVGVLNGWKAHPVRPTPH